MLRSPSQPGLVKITSARRRRIPRRRRTTARSEARRGLRHLERRGLQPPRRGPAPTSRPSASSASLTAPSRPGSPRDRLDRHGHRDARRPGSRRRGARIAARGTRQPPAALDLARRSPWRRNGAGRRQRSRRRSGALARRVPTVRLWSSAIGVVALAIKPMKARRGVNPRRACSATSTGTARRATTSAARARRQQSEAHVTVCEELGIQRALSHVRRGLAAVRQGSSLFDYVPRSEHADHEAPFCYPIRRSFQGLQAAAGRPPAHAPISRRLQDLRRAAIVLEHVGLTGASRASSKELERAPGGEDDHRNQVGGVWSRRQLEPLAPSSIAARSSPRTRLYRTEI